MWEWEKTKTKRGRRRRSGNKKPNKTQLTKSQETRSCALYEEMMIMLLQLACFLVFYIQVSSFWNQKLEHFGDFFIKKNKIRVNNLFFFKNP
jgi:hypothetical protein